MTLPAVYYADASVTLYHADALDVLPLLPTGSVDAVVTDPPYSSGGAFRGDRAASVVDKYVCTKTLAYRPDFAGDNRDQRGFLAWATLWLNAARVASAPGATLSCFTDWRQLPTTTDAVQAGGWMWRGICPWTKGYGRPMGAGRYSNAAEYVVWGTKGPAREQGAFTVGAFDCQPEHERVHVAQKPVDVMRWLLGVVPPQGRVLDPFVGSGSTLFAARAIGLDSIGIEVDESACEVAARRLEHMPRGTDAQPSLFGTLLEDT